MNLIFLLVLFCLPVGWAQQDPLEHCAELMFGQRFTPAEAIDILRTAANIATMWHVERRETREDRFAEQLILMMTGLSPRPRGFPGGLHPSRAAAQEAEARELVEDPHYTPARSPRGMRARWSQSTMNNILVMDARGASTATIKAKYKWYRRDLLNKIREAAAAGRRPSETQSEIDRFVYDRVLDHRNRHRILRGWMLQHWGRQRARELGSNFKACRTWMQDFKRRNRIRGRKVTKRVSRAQQDNTARNEAARMLFVDDFGEEHVNYPERAIWNFDHSGFNYAISSDRTLSFVGERDTLAYVDQANKATHSYTIIPMISRDGRTIGKLLICFQEPRGQFGPRVAPRIRALEERYENINAIASASGKLTTDLMQDWIDKVVQPAVQQSNCQAGPSTSPPPSRSVLLLGDSWGGNTNSRTIEHLADLGVQFMQIPPGTTSEIQPLDTVFFRQYKYLIKRIIHAAEMEHAPLDVESREGIANLHSLAWNQLSAPVYEGMLRRAWEKVDSNFTADEVPDMAKTTVKEIQFDDLEHGQLCHHEGCNHTAFIRCAHCGEPVCIHHFLKREHFHHRDDNDFRELAIQDGLHDDDDDDDFDDDFDADLYFPNRTPACPLGNTSTPAHAHSPTPEPARAVGATPASRGSAPGPSASGADEDADVESYSPAPEPASAVDPAYEFMTPAGNNASSSANENSDPLLYSATRMPALAPDTRPAAARVLFPSSHDGLKKK